MNDVTESQQTIAANGMKGLRTTFRQISTVFVTSPNKSTNSLNKVSLSNRFSAGVSCFSGEENSPYSLPKRAGPRTCLNTRGMELLVNLFKSFRKSLMRGGGFVGKEKENFRTFSKFLNRPCIFDEEVDVGDFSYFAFSVLIWDEVGEDSSAELRVRNV